MNDVIKGWTIPVLDHGYCRLIDWMGGDVDILEAARVSYKSPSKGKEQDVKLLHYLYKNQHTSPFEMVKVKFNIKMPIFVMRQYIRHRMQNLNEVSARYTKLPNEFYIPNKWRKQDTINKQGSQIEEDWDNMWYCKGHTKNKEFSSWIQNHCYESYALYEKMLEAGISREMARMVLPLNIYTEFYCCWDMKNLLHFIHLRDDSHAQLEIQEYSKTMKTMVKKLFPITIGAFEKYKWKLIEE